MILKVFTPVQAEKKAVSENPDKIQAAPQSSTPNSQSSFRYNPIVMFALGLVVSCMELAVRIEFAIKQFTKIEG